LKSKSLVLAADASGAPKPISPKSAVAAVTKIKMRVFKQANVNLSLSHVEQSGDSRANGARLSDLIAKAIQSEIKDEIHADRKDLHQLREIEVSTSPQFADGCRQRLPYSKPGWIIRATPSSKKLDHMLDTRTSLSKAAKRRILAQLHARLAELQPGG
jgi:hypothetical protein